MIFLGTGAAELLPDPFCDCTICADARKSRFLRRRSAFMLDDNTLIDFGPEVASAVFEFGMSFCALENILITHTHNDHFALSNLGLLNMSLKKYDKPVNLYISEMAWAWLQGVWESAAEPYSKHVEFAKLINDKLVKVTRVKPFKEFEMRSQKHSYTVLPVLGNHRVGTHEESEQALNYVITFNGGKLCGKRILYASDTGLYGEETISTLKDVHLDFVVMEAGGGTQEQTTELNHLSASGFIRQIETLREIGAVNEHSRIYATHIGHVKQTLNHSSLQEYFDANSGLRISVAYDGMRIGE